MYDSPIELFTAEIQAKLEDGVVDLLKHIDIDVDKDELLRALKYDRDQYHKGFSDGKRAGYAERDEEIVRCVDCKHHEDEQPGAIWCHYYIGSWVENDFFCAYGERRTDADEPLGT